MIGKSFVGVIPHPAERLGNFEAKITAVFVLDQCGMEFQASRLRPGKIWFEMRAYPGNGGFRSFFPAM